MKLSLSLINAHDMFVTVLCTEELTGPVGLSELADLELGLTAVPLGNDSWNLSGLALGEQLIQAFDPSGRIVTNERRIIGPSGNVVVDLSHCSVGTYTLTVCGEYGRGVAKVAVIR